MPSLKIFRRGPADDYAPQPKPRVLFVSHEATRTGAPKIILNLLKHAAENYGLNSESIIHEDGHLTHEFSQHSLVHCLNLPRQRSSELQRKVRAIVRRRSTEAPTVAICNSMESRFVAEQLKQLSIPVLSLIHELPCSYTDDDYEIVYSSSHKIVFPVKAVREATDKKSPIPFGRDVVIPQGLLDPNFGSCDSAETARKELRQELSIPADSFVVLGCGTLDMRKGIDHFAAIARQVCQQQQFAERPIHFVWVGGGPQHPHSVFHYIQIDLRKSQIATNVHFIGEREHTESYFLGADLFLLPSRVDPFPCVVHEAMACRLPVLTFDRSGGAAEAVDGGAGLVVPYANHEVAAQMIVSLYHNRGLTDGIRETAHTKVFQQYDFGRYAEKIIGLAEEVGGIKLSPQQPRLKIRSAA